MTFIPFTEKFLIPMFSSKENGAAREKCSKWPFLGPVWPFTQLKQIKGTPEERASCSWPYFYLHPSFLRLNMPIKRKKQNTLRCFSIFGKSSDNAQLSGTWFLQAAIIKLLLFLCFSLCKAIANG